MKINFGKVNLKKKINFGKVKLGVKKIYPESETLEVIPNAEEQSFSGLYKDVVVKKIPIEITAMSYLFVNDRFEDDYDLILDLIEKTTKIDFAFNNCKKLTSLDLSHIDMSECVQINNAFGSCSNLLNLKFGENQSKEVTRAESMFSGCSNLRDLDMSNFDFGKVTQIQSIFNKCPSLTNFKCFKNLGKGYTTSAKNYYACCLDVSACELLTFGSLMTILGGVYDLNLSYNVANGGTLVTQSLILGDINKAKLSSGIISIATKKGWTVK